MKQREATTGAWVMGLMDAHDLNTKTITLKSGVHPSTFSRFVNGVKPISDKQMVQIGMAIGEARAEARIQKRVG